MDLALDGTFPLEYHFKKWRHYLMCLDGLGFWCNAICTWGTTSKSLSFIIL